jgi:hypothetical protein
MEKQKTSHIRVSQNDSLNALGLGEMNICTERTYVGNFDGIETYLTKVIFTRDGKPAGGFCEISVADDDGIRSLPKSMRYFRHPTKEEREKIDKYKLYQ